MRSIRSERGRDPGTDSQTGRSGPRQKAESKAQGGKQRTDEEKKWCEGENGVEEEDGDMAVEGRAAWREAGTCSVVLGMSTARLNQAR